MSTCTKWVNQFVITCKNWTSEIDYRCTQWADEGIAYCEKEEDQGYDECAGTEDQGYNKCSKTEDQGYSECARREDQGYKDCCDWWPCSWACDAWTWISNIVCVAWTWISNIVCVAWTWISNIVCIAWTWISNIVCIAWYSIAKWVCKAFAFIIRAVCVVFSWVLRLICVAWDTIRCALLNFSKWLLSLFLKKKPSPSIEHVFVLMLENRSFDHMLGFSKIDGIDQNGNPATINGADPLTNENVNPVNGVNVPVNFPADFQLKNVDNDPGHEFENTLTSLCGEGSIYNSVAGGYPQINNSGFIQNYFDNGSATPQRIMNCYTPNQLPVINALAKEFAVCDNWFSSLPGPTWPNRFFLLAATSGGLDNSPSTLDIISSTTVEGYRFENGNIFDLLDANCIKWRIFEGDDFPVSFALNGMNLNDLQGRFKDFNDFESEVNKTNFSDRFIFIEPKYGSHKIDITGPGDFTCGNSMHPLDDVIRGEKLIKKVYEVIRNSPHWRKSLLLITFDEHGGFYDHVQPPAAVPPGDLVTAGYRKEYPAGHPQAGQLINFQFDQLGVRVPALVISPYIRKGIIDHTIYDHTSMLNSIEKLFKMTNLTQRDKAANDFLHLLSLNTPRSDSPAILPDPAINPDPLVCEDDDESDDVLLIRRSELKIAKKEGTYKERPLIDYKLTTSQIGFVQVALLKVLQTAEYPERIQWVEEYKEIATGIDAAIFMTDARLKLKYSIDFKKFTRPPIQKKKSDKNLRKNTKE